MGDDQGIRTPLQRITDMWAELSLWNRFGLSFVLGVALIVIIFTAFGWVFSVGSG